MVLNFLNLEDDAPLKILFIYKSFSMEYIFFISRMVPVIQFCLECDWKSWKCLRIIHITCGNCIMWVSQVFLRALKLFTHLKTQFEPFKFWILPKKITVFWQKKVRESPKHRIDRLLCFFLYFFNNYLFRIWNKCHKINLENIFVSS